MQQQRKDVATLLHIGRLAPLRDHGVGSAVQQRQADPREADRLIAAEVHQLCELRRRPGGGGDQPPDRRAQLVLWRCALGPALDAEDPAHDHVERDRLHPRGKRERCAHGPAVDLALGCVGDHLRVAIDRLAVERRQQQLALAHVP